MARMTTAKRKPSKITVLLGAEEYRRFDVYCEEQGFKKSTLIARLIREHLNAAKFEVQPVLAPRRNAAR